MSIIKRIVSIFRVIRDSAALILADYRSGAYNVRPPSAPIVYREPSPEPVPRKNDVMGTGFAWSKSSLSSGRANIEVN